MAYITPDYYKDEFKGKLPQDPNELTVLIERASDVVDMITQYKITEMHISHELIGKLIKKATASQVQYFVLEGGYENIFGGSKDDLSSVGVGGFNYSKESKNPSNHNEMASVATIEYLSYTGLLYAGVDRRW